VKTARTWATLLAIACVDLGCFSLEHRLPPNAYFGRPPYGLYAEGVGFEADASKSWALGGMLPYSDWSSAELLSAQGADAARTVSLREIETVFSPLDVVLQIVPGTAAGVYYVWATRTIRVSGEMRGAEKR
jgi:hypothetical protein